MKREQMIMAVGAPVSDENPNLKIGSWRYWLSSLAELDAIFDNGLLIRLQAKPGIRPGVAAE